ncbi:alpha/beta-hydrolase [Mollisia scopiformis]|uniref:Alpha/beta-hydrolase n=1 Tax=Mollisia scopiformis TaxID=149040 RepID=A0A194WYN0_MOLSC|nr:alpha/beta-hydrolase [Mollisia scopiformis]KUJ12799.1 alpha/beta-hydrolase [Mollisia scopiformis]
MFVPQVAEQFQLLGVTALIFDPRSTGASDGIPRNEIDPMKQVEDYSDAHNFLSTLTIVDSKAIGFWGMSFSAAVSLCAAALDKRAKFIIAVCPLLSFGYSKERLLKVLAKAMQDRASQKKGNSPFYLPMLNDKGENPAGFGMGMDEEVFDHITSAMEWVPSFENRTTIQSYFKMVMWQPSGLMQYVSPTPVMFVVPELDKVSPPEDQLALFETFSEPKKLHIAQGKGHLNVLSGEDFPSLMKMQAEWLATVLEKRP